MNTGRPRSWYAVPQPYTNQAPGQQAPLPPGAPDFPPVSAAPIITASSGRGTYQSGEHDIQSSQSQRHQYDLQHPNGQARYASLPLATSQNGGPPAHAAHMAGQWSPGHYSRHSQPILPSQTEGTNSRLASPSVDVPVRAKSPKLGSHHVHERYDPRQNPTSTSSADDASGIVRIRSPQPRRNTIPAPILPSNTDQASIPAGFPTSRRPLPAPPGLGSAVAPNVVREITTEFSRSPSPSPDLTRPASVASNASAGSTGGTRRRPLPQPPSLSRQPEPYDHYTQRTCGSKPPASYAEAQASVSRNTFPSHQYPGGLRNHPNASQEEPAHVQDVRSRIEQMTVQAREAADKKAASENSASPQPGTPSIPAIQVPSISVPSFSFDEPDEPSSSTAPAISISMAPLSPSLKATSSNYFDSQLEDEHVPLPSSSVPMATSTKAHATACPRCQRPVLYGRTVNAMGKRWHPDCFVCEQCETKLEHMEFFTKDSKPYCHVDFHEVSSSNIGS